MIKKILLLILGVMMFLAVLFAFNNAYDEALSGDLEEVIKQEISSTVVIKDKITKIENSEKSIFEKIPEFQNLENDYESYINKKIYTDLNADDVYNDITEGLEETEIEKFTYEMDYTRYNCEDYVSIVASQYINVGFARPRIQKKCYVIDAKQNKSASLVDVVSNKVGYKEKILNEINKQAKERNIELVGGNGLDNLSDIQSFYIKDKKLVIYFEVSEIAATALGELEFEMPFEMIDNKFVLS